MLALLSEDKCICLFDDIRISTFERSVRKEEDPLQFIIATLCASLIIFYNTLFTHTHIYIISASYRDTAFLSVSTYKVGGGLCHFYLEGVELKVK